MAAGKELNPTEYIGHHLTHGTKQFGDGGFWTINFDSLSVSILLGLVGIGFIWWVVRGATSGVPNRRQAFVELLIGFIDAQAKGIFRHGDRNAFVAPAALTVFVWMLMIYFSIAAKGFGGWMHEIFFTPFGKWMLPANFLFNLIEYVSKPLSHSLRLYGNMYAGELIFLLLWLLAAAGLGWMGLSFVLGLGWAIFHILIVALQPYIFMMLTVVYLAMAHEHHG